MARMAVKIKVKRRVLKQPSSGISSKTCPTCKGSGRVNK